MTDPDILISVSTDYQQLVERLGFKVMATTTFEDGVSFEAHNTIHTKLVRGLKMATPEDAMRSLYEKCRGR